MTNPPVAPGLGVQAARLLDVPSALDYESAGVVPPTRFLHWYRPHEFRRIDFAALIQATNSLNLRGAVVVIGAKPGPGLPGAVSDTFASPWSRFNGGFVSGATVHAVILANYAAGDWIRDMPEAVRIGFGVFGAAVVMLAAWRLNARRPILVWCVPPAALLLSAALAVTLFCAVHVWWPWLLVGGLVPAVAAFWLRWKPVPLPLDIFISYRRKADGETAALLFRELNRRGLVAFYAPENIPAGSFHEHLPAQIHRSRCMVLVLSPRTLAAESLQGIDWVRFEIHAARAAHKTFIPVLKDGFGFRADSWPADLGTLNEWQSFTAVEYEGDGQISTVVEKVINLVQRL